MLLTIELRIIRPIIATLVLPLRVMTTSMMERKDGVIQMGTKIALCIKQIMKSVLKSREEPNEF